MKVKSFLSGSLLIAGVFLFTSALVPSTDRNRKAIDPPGVIKKYLYVAVPGIRDYLGYGGHGILVFDISNNHRFVKRIPTKGFHPGQYTFQCKRNCGECSAQQHFCKYD